MVDCQTPDSSLKHTPACPLLSSYWCRGRPHSSHPELALDKLTSSTPSSAPFPALTSSKLLKRQLMPQFPHWVETDGGLSEQRAWSRAPPTVSIKYMLAIFMIPVGFPMAPEQASYLKSYLIMSPSAWKSIKNYSPNGVAKRLGPSYEVKPKVSVCGYKR